jgi:hypothetical protein
MKSKIVGKLKLTYDVLGAPIGDGDGYEVAGERVVEVDVHVDDVIEFLTLIPLQYKTNAERDAYVAGEKAALSYALEYDDGLCEAVFEDRDFEEFMHSKYEHKYC